MFTTKLCREQLYGPSGTLGGGGVPKGQGIGRCRTRGTGVLPEGSLGFPRLSPPVFQGAKILFFSLTIHENPISKRVVAPKKPT